MNPNTLKAIDAQPSGESTLHRIERYVANPPENSRVVTITPEIAAQILQGRNVLNRPKSFSEIKKLADNMAGGYWRLTGDTIKFSKTGRLLDGQHRLSACVQSEMPFQTHVVFGIDDDAFDFLDQTKRRVPADILSIAGYKNHGRLAKAIRWAYLIDEGRAKQRDTLEPHAVLTLARGRYKGVEEFIPIGQAVNKTSPLIPDEIAAGLLYHFSLANPEKCRIFHEKWASGAWGGKFKIFDKLSKELRRLHEASSGRVNDVVRAALIVITWNAFVDGRVGTSSDFDWTPTQDEFPTIKG